MFGSISLYRCSLTSWTSAQQQSRVGSQAVVVAEKTMLLRYLSHQSAFSPKRRHYADNALKQIGLYWKVDTHFANLLVGRNIPEDVWQSAFAHFTSLAIALDAIQCLASIAASSFSGFSLEELGHLSLNSST